MLIGVISDTHDQVANIKRVTKILNQEKVELVIHCGDWVAPFTLKFYEGLQCPMKGVFGNNDGDRFRHLQRKDRWSFDLEYQERFLELELDGRKIAVFHGDYPGWVDSLVKSKKYDAVFHGHTHQKVNERIDGVLSLNPGTLLEETDENTKGASIAIYDTETNSARHIDL